MNNRRPLDSADQTHDDTPPHATSSRSASFLSDDALTHSETFASFANAADETGCIVFDWLYEQQVAHDAAEALRQAGRDFAMWLTAHGRLGELKVTVGWDNPRVLITLADLVKLEDLMPKIPDLHRSRRDVGMIFRMLLHYTVDWSCDVDEQGNRITQIYGDVTASKTADSEEWL